MICIICLWVEGVSGIVHSWLWVCEIFVYIIYSFHVYSEWFRNSQQMRISTRLMSTWTKRMSDERFQLFKRIVDSPSPVNLEAAMTRGVIAPYLSNMNSQWKVHTFIGSASLVVDSWGSKTTKPALTVMVVGHADKIRMQVSREAERLRKVRD